MTTQQDVGPGTIAAPGGVRAEAQPEQRGAAVPRGLFDRESTVATAVVAIVIIAAMQVMSFFTPDFILPRPAQVAQAIGEVLIRNPLDLAATIVRVAAGLVLALVIGSLIGAIMGLSKAAGRYGRATLFIMTGVPALSWMLLAVLWFKETEVRLMFILLIVMLPFYAMNVYDGFRSLPKDWIEMIEVFRPTRLQTLKLLVAPHIVPYIILTTKSVAGYGIRMAIFAELIGAAIGVGARISQSQSMFRTDRVFAWTILLILLNFAVQGIITLVERKVLAYRSEVNIR